MPKSTHQFDRLLAEPGLSRRPTDRAPATHDARLGQLLTDPDFSRTLKLVAEEVVYKWRIPDTLAGSFVLSAIGEPTALESIHDAWSEVKHPEECLGLVKKSLGLVKVIIRRRVLDLLAKDARRAGHSSLEDAASDGEDDLAFELFLHDPRHNPRIQLECRQIIELIRTEIRAFATRGDVPHRQAHLLQRRFLDEIPYTELCVELGCSPKALRVRVCKAIRAFRKHIEVANPGLL